MSKSSIKRPDLFASFAVDNARKAQKFYEDKLGLEVVEYEDMKGMFEIHGAGKTKVFVYEKGKQHKPANFTVLNIPVSNITRKMTALKKKGVKFEVYNGSKSSGGMRTDINGLARFEDPDMAIAWFKDPSGNIISLIED